MKSSSLDDSVLIRDFRKSDLDDLLRLLPICNADEFQATGFDPDHLRGLVNRWFGWTGRFLLGLIGLFGTKPLKFLAAEADGKLVGTTLIEERGRLGSVSAVMVDPDYRRRGIATKLMTRALEYLRQRSKARAVLSVFSANAAAIELYVKLGFRIFAHECFFLGEKSQFVEPENVEGVIVRPFRDSDLDEVYALVITSEDSGRLKTYDFKKNNLKTRFLTRFLRASKMAKLVAVHDNRIVGYVEVSYTTPTEVGRIGFLYSSANGRKMGVDKLLVNAARSWAEKAGVSRLRVTIPSTQIELVGTVNALKLKKAFEFDDMVAEFF